ncbi:MAG: hypothetical protein LRY40_02360 [Shewanella fodinae]|nr:hypothetical protein [Shewanella fodinae]
MKRNLIMMLLPLALFATTAAQAFDKATIEKGEYLSRAGDCIACHSIPNGAPFAGGLAIDSPFGKFIPPILPRVRLLELATTRWRNLMRR